MDPPAEISLGGSQIQDILGTVRADGGFSDVEFSFRYTGTISGDFVNVAIPVSVSSVDGIRWSDRIVMRVYREPMSIYFRSVSNPIQGVLLSPERESLQFSTESRSGNVQVPRRSSPYLLALTGADYNSETKYSFRIDESPIDDGSSLTDASFQEPNNDETTATPAYVQLDHLGYLGVYNLDFYSITNELADGQHLVWTGIIPEPDSTTQNTTPTFSWNDFAGITGYEFRTAESEAALSASPITALTVAQYSPASALSNNSRHYWQVGGVSEAGSKTEWSPVYLFLIQWGSVGVLSPASGSTVSTPSPTLS